MTVDVHHVPNMRWPITNIQYHSILPRCLLLARPRCRIGSGQFLLYHDLANLKYLADLSPGRYSKRSVVGDRSSTFSRSRCNTIVKLLMGPASRRKPTDACNNEVVCLFGDNRSSINMAALPICRLGSQPSRVRPVRLAITGVALTRRP